MTNTMKTNKSYSELIKLKTFKERFEYLKLNGSVGEATFGYDRIFNQMFYKLTKWQNVRDKVILRDNGCDMGMEGYDIYGKIIVHHINPITMQDILNESSKLFDPENLICVSHTTHNAIHYSNENILAEMPVERKKNDTCPWKK